MLSSLRLGLLAVAVDELHQILQKLLVALRHLLLPEEQLHLPDEVLREPALVFLVGLAQVVLVLYLFACGLLCVLVEDDVHPLEVVLEPVVHALHLLGLLHLSLHALHALPMQTSLPLQTADLPLVELDLLVDQLFLYLHTLNRLLQPRYLRLQSPRPHPLLHQLARLPLHRPLRLCQLLLQQLVLGLHPGNLLPQPPDLLLLRAQVLNALGDPFLEGEDHFGGGWVDELRLREVFVDLSQHSGPRHLHFWFGLPVLLRRAIVAIIQDLLVLISDLAQVHQLTNIMPPLLIIQMNQKKKQGQVKKLNRVKSEDAMPIGSLMQEIGQLKEELKCIRQGKKEEGRSETKEDKENKQVKDIAFVQVECISRETQLKVEMELSKLRRAIQSRDQAKIEKTVNEILEVFNSQMKQMMAQRNRFKLQTEELIFIYDTYRKEEEEKYRIVMRNNQKLQQEVDLLKREVGKITEEEARQECQRKEREEERVEEIDRLVKENQDLYRSNSELQALIEEWQLQCRALKEKCLSYQKNLQHKSQEMAFLEEDIKYLRLQSEKFKAQKKQIQKLWEKSTQQGKEMRRAMQQELQKAEREKNKWMNECSLRRQESQQIQAIESHKSLLFKEIQELRNNYTLKCKELAQNKSLLHEAQRKMIGLESENYRMAQEREKAKRQTEFWQTEMDNLRGEVEELRSLQSRSGEVRRAGVAQLSGKKGRQQKLRALQDIHSLIRKHQNEIDETD